MKKLTALLTVLTMLLTLCLTAAGCSGGSPAAATPKAEGPSGAQTGTIKIGASFPLSGSVATDGNMIVTAIRMAVDEANAAGGVTIGGTAYNIVLDPQDDEADPTTAATIDRELIKKDQEWTMDLFPRLRERSGQIAGTLSGGELQMLSIARSLMARPRVLLISGFREEGTVWRTM